MKSCNWFNVIWKHSHSMRFRGFRFCVLPFVLEWLKHRGYHFWQLVVFRAVFMWKAVGFMEFWYIAFPQHTMKLKNLCWISWFIRFPSKNHHFSWKLLLFSENCHFSCEKWQFSWKAVVFMKSGGFQWKVAVFMEFWYIAFPQHTMKLKNLCWISWFIRFPSENCHFSHENHHFSWKLLLFMKTATFHAVFSMRFWVITKYRSFERKTKHKNVEQIYYISEWTTKSFSNISSQWRIQGVHPPLPQHWRI